MSYKIYTDASADVSEELMHDVPAVEMIPMNVELDGVPYLYGPGGNLDNKMFYAAQRSGKFASTSQINPVTYKEYFSKSLEKGEDVIYLGLTQGISGSFMSANLAMEDLREKYPERKIVAVETYCAAVGLGMLVHEAARMQGQGYTFEELVDWVEKHRLNICHWFTVDVFEHLRHGGRVSGTAATVGSLLNIKPLLHIENDGTLKVMEKPRGRKQAIRHQIAHMKEDWIPEKMGNLVVIGHGDDMDALNQCKEAVLAEFPQADIRPAYIGALIGAHTGPGMLALIYWGRKR